MGDTFGMDQIHPCTENASVLRSACFYLNVPTVEDHAKRLQTFCMRHRHNTGYCMKDNKCRFGFPRPISDRTRAVVKDILYKRGASRGKIRQTVIELLFKTNDGWMSSHSPFALKTWASNIDFSLLIDSYSVIRYICKYCTKIESPSQALKQIVRDGLREVEERDGDTDVRLKRVLRRTFNRITGRRDKSIMETTHLIMSRPFVYCDHTFQSVNLLGTQRAINVEGSHEDGPAIKETILDLYSSRMHASKWVNYRLFHEYRTLSMDMNLVHFAKTFRAVRGKITHIGETSNRIIPIFSPDISCTDKKSEHFYKYALISLLKHKPWNTKMQMLYNGTNDVPSSLDEMHDCEKELVINAFQEFFRDEDLPTYCLDSPMLRELHRVQGDLSGSTINSILSMENLDSIDEALKYKADNDFDDDESWGDNNYWDKDATFPKMLNTYADNEEIKEERIDEVKRQNKESSPNHERPAIYLKDFTNGDIGSIQQKEVIETFLKMCGLGKDEKGNFIDNDSSNQTNVLLCPGPAGTGKSYVIDCIITEIKLRYEEKFQISAEVLVLAPTGKAAVNCGGATINSNQGLSVPVQNLGDASQHYTCGPALRNLQQRLMQVIACIIDEMSMISSLQLYWISRRLQEGKCNFEKDFGGVPTLFLGDFGQLAPVMGTPMWLPTTASGKALPTIAKEGNKLYEKITTVLWLTEVRRQKGQFKDILLRLRNGRNTKEDWETINDKCSLESENKVSGYNDYPSDESLYIMSTNEGCREINKQLLTALKELIYMMDAEHDLPSTATFSAEFCRRLERKLVVSLRSRVILLWNLCTQQGLVNGSCGTVVDIIYNEGCGPPSLAKYIIVNFEDYMGKPFFKGKDRERWVPIGAEIYEFRDAKGDRRYRKQFPIQCAWALTAWKSQGLTWRHRVTVEITSKETHTGLTYVMMSRCTDINNLRISKSITLERLTNEICKSVLFKKRLIEEEKLKQTWRKTRHRLGYTVNVETVIDVASNIFEDDYKPKAKMDVRKVHDKKRKREEEKNLSRKSLQYKSVKEGNKPFCEHSTEGMVMEILQSSVQRDRPRNVRVESTIKSRLQPLLQQFDSSHDTLSRKPDLVIARLTHGGANMVETVDLENFLRLKENVWISDMIVNYFYRLLRKRESLYPQESRRGCHFVSSFFYTQLMQNGEFNYNSIARYKRSIPNQFKNLFQLRKIFIPINTMNTHWSLILVNMEDHRIQYYDSLRQNDTTYATEVCNNIMRYLEEEWLSNKNNNADQFPNDPIWQIEIPQTPQQILDDCGIFMLMFTYFLSDERDVRFMNDQRNHAMCRYLVALSVLTNEVYNIELLL